MRKMSVTELWRYIDQLKPDCIVYNASDQPGYDPYNGDPLINIKGRRLLFTITNPNKTVSLVSDNAIIQFDRVRYAVVHENYNEPYSTVYLFCLAGMENTEKKYKLIVF